MSHCEATVENLVAHLDGELSAEDRAAVEAHLESCGLCRREMEELGRVQGLLDGLAASGGGGAAPAGRSSWAAMAARLDGEESNGAGATERPSLVAIPGGRAGEPRSKGTTPPRRAGSTRRGWALAGAAIAASIALALVMPDRVPSPERIASTDNEIPAELLHDPDRFLDLAIVMDLDELESGASDAARL